MIDDEDNVIWIIENIWVGDRIVRILKTEGSDEWLTEYEYDGAGNRVVQRDIHNGVLERLIHSEGEKETEELYLNGIVVLRAYWENGRKIHEERVRH
jgi:YD repeat-containing protein